jgi:hypothetical protein
MNQITLRDVLDNIDDLCQDFTVTSIDNGNKVRQANRAIEYVQSILGLPSSISTYSFFYYQDVQFYDTPEGFNEFIQLYYNTTYPSISTDYNNPRFRWNLYKDSELLRSTGGGNFNGFGSQLGAISSNRVAVTRINGKNQLLLSGQNIHGMNTYNSFDSTAGLTYSSDISGAVVDTNIYKEGSGSLKFNIASGLTKSTVTMTGNWNIQNLFNQNGIFRMFVDFPVGTSRFFSNVEIQFTSSVGNYYSITTTNQTDGSAWTENVWDWLSFPLANATTVGSPNSTLITSINIIFNHSGTFAPVSNLRIDYLYEVNPDYLNLSFYNFFKGTNSDGDDIVYLTDDTDMVSFGDIAPSLLDAVAIRAAMKLFPQLRGDASFWNMYKADFSDVVKALGKTFPRTRATGGAGKSEILRG